MISNRLVWCMAVIAIAGSTALAGTFSVSQIAPNGTDTSSSGRAIIWSGTKAIAVGLSGSGTGIVWDATAGTRAVVSSDNAAATVMTGIGYRTVSGNKQLVASGMTGSGLNLYNSLDDGATWGTKCRWSNSTYTNQNLGTSNTLGASTASDVVYEALGNKPTTNYLVDILTCSGGTSPVFAPAITQISQKDCSTNDATFKGAASTGLSVGYRKVSGVENNYKGTPNGAGVSVSFFPGLAGDNRGQAWAVSNNGNKIFGMSPVTGTRTGNWPYINDVATNVTTELRTFSDTAGSTTNGNVYGASADGKWAVGMDYRGTEKAVLWNTQTNEIWDLTTELTGKLNGFSRLSRGYSIYDAGVDGLWITGNGVWAADLSTRGFVAMIPEPATMSLLVLGGLAMLRRRR